MDCCPPGSSVHGDSSEKNTGVGCHAFLQGIFPTQGLNPGLPHCRWILYHLSYQGSPRILEWVAFPFSRESSQLRAWRIFFTTRASCSQESLIVFCILVVLAVNSFTSDFIHLANHHLSLQWAETFLLVEGLKYCGIYQKATQKN